jgi:hypothetical protein
VPALRRAVYWQKDVTECTFACDGLISGSFRIRNIAIIAWTSQIVDNEKTESRRPARRPVDTHRAGAPRRSPAHNKQLRRRSTLAASAANLQQNLSFRLKRPSGRRDCPTGPLGSNGGSVLSPGGFGKAPSATCTCFVQPQSVPADPSAVILQSQLGNFMIVINATESASVRVG